MEKLPQRGYSLAENCTVSEGGSQGGALEARVSVRERMDAMLPTIMEYTCARQCVWVVQAAHSRAREHRAQHDTDLRDVLCGEVAEPHRNDRRVREVQAGNGQARAPPPDTANLIRYRAPNSWSITARCTPEASAY